MKHRAEARRRRTRESILGSASDLFLTRGFLETNMDDVAAAAGVSKQTVYAHFRTKEALFLEIVSHMTSEAGDEHKDQVPDPADDQPLEAFLLDFAQSQLGIVLTPRLMRLRRLVIGEAERFPDLGEALHRSGPGRSIERLSRAFARYQKSGQMIVADPRTAASFFNWLVMGEPVNAAMFLGEGAIPRRDKLRKHAKEAVGVFMRAYGTSQPHQL
jgi:TetR/AcrR family transcriptional regulator, mexJK operon transcriptional repressor